MPTTGTDETLHAGITVSTSGSSGTSGNFLLCLDWHDVARCLIVAQTDGC
jgi:hypothetical protein